MDNMKRKVTVNYDTDTVIKNMRAMLSSMFGKCNLSKTKGSPETVLTLEREYVKDVIRVTVRKLTNSSSVIIIERLESINGHGMYDNMIDSWYHKICYYAEHIQEFIHQK